MTDKCNDTIAKGLIATSPLSQSPMANGRVLVTWDNCGCYTEALGQGKRYYPCHGHELAFDELLAKRVPT